MTFFNPSLCCLGLLGRFQFYIDRFCQEILAGTVRCIIRSCLCVLQGRMEELGRRREERVSFDLLVKDPSGESAAGIAGKRVWMAALGLKRALTGGL